MAITIKGKLLGIYQSNDFIKDGGEVIPGKLKAQILTTAKAKNGETVNGINDVIISKEVANLLKQKEGHEVELEIIISSKNPYSLIASK